MATRFECRQGRRATPALLPQLEAAIAQLEAEIAQLGGEGDAVADVALLRKLAGAETPLPVGEFAELLDVWDAPAPPTELAQLLTQVEALDTARHEGERADESSVGQGGSDGDPMATNPVLERVKATEPATGRRRRPRTRPRRRFEEVDDGGSSMSDGSLSSSPRTVSTPGASLPVVEAGSTENKPPFGAEDRDAAAKAEVKEAPEGSNETQDVVPDPALAAKSSDSVRVTSTTEATDPENTTTRAEETTGDRATDAATVLAGLGEGVSTAAGEEAQAAKPAETAAATAAVTPTTVIQVPEAGAEQALARLKALRQSMMLDVLSKVVSVAKSKGVDPGMYSSLGEAAVGADLIDLQQLAQYVEAGIVHEWSQFAQQVYLFCHRVIADAESADQSGAKQKGMELLHFARTLTETLRQASIKKEASLLEKIRNGNPNAVPSSPAVTDHAVAKAEAAAAAVSAVSNAASVAKDITSDDSDNKRAEKTEEDATSSPPAASAAKEASEESFDLSTPTRASARLRHRGSSVSEHSASGDGIDNNDTEESTTAEGSSTIQSATPSTPAVRRRKRSRTASASLGLGNVDHSESESQVSASEVEPKTRERAHSDAPSSGTSPKTTPAKRRTRKRRPVVPATRASSRQQKKRADAAAAAAAAAAEESEANDEGTGTGTAEEDNSDVPGSDTAESPTPVSLTKTGRPRKKPGRKPKKQDTK